MSSIVEVETPGWADVRCWLCKNEPVEYVCFRAHTDNRPVGVCSACIGVHESLHRKASEHAN